MKKFFSMILALLMLVPMLAACNTNPADTATANTDDVETTPISSGKTEPELSGATYDGSKFYILVANSGIGKLNDFAPENKDQYSRVAAANNTKVKTVEALYDIDIEDVEQFGAANGNGGGYQKVTTDFASGTTSYHMCVLGTYDAAQLAIEGYLYDLNSLPYVDLDCKWWDQDANNDLMIHDKMFYTTGDISTVDNLATHILLFNKELAAGCGITDIYTSVTDKKWTVDKFISYIKLASDDVDGSQTMDHLDKFGLLTWNDVLQASLSASRVRIATINDNSEMELTLYSDKSVSLMDKLCSIFNDGNYVYNYTTRNTTATQPSNTYDSERDNMFNENRALFYATTCNTIPRHRNSTSLDFGIIPYPMYDEEQGIYGSYVGASYSAMICVESTTTDVNYVGTVIESLAYEGMKTTTPAYYDQLLKGAFVRDEESGEMLDIIFNQRCFDVGIYYKLPSESPYTSHLTSIISKRENGTFTSRYSQSYDAAIADIIKLNSKIQNELN